MNNNFKLEPELQAVYDLVVSAHGRFNAQDKGGLALYHWHLSRVAIRLGNSATVEEKKAALCHDLLEDTDVTVEDLVRVGLGSQAVEAVQLCSNIYYKNTTHKLWMSAIAENPNLWGKKVKLADLGDNHSFERMLGLDEFFRQQRLEIQQVSTKIKTPMNLAQKAFKNADKSMKKKSHSGLWGRYLKDMDILLSHGDNSWSKDINIGAFGTYDEYVSLYTYLGEKEFLEYRDKQKVQGIRVECAIELIKDRSGQNYLVALVPAHISNLYRQSLHAITDNSYALIENQQKRDGDKNHITLLSAQEYGSLLKSGSKEYQDIVNKKISTKEVFDFYSVGALKEIITPKGTTTPVDNKVYYALCENGSIQSMRRQIGLADKELHATLGFTHKDIFNQRKNMSTKTCSFAVVWDELNKSIPDLKTTKALKF